MPTSGRREAVQHRDGAVGLRYVGNGAAPPDVPARDLSADEALLYGRNELLASGLYTDAAPVVEEAPAAPAETE